MKKFICFIFIAFVTACLPEKEQSPLTFEKQTLRIDRADSPAVVLNVEIADTDKKRARGLMYRTQMNDDEGMLFLFPVKRKASMWMANTPMSLDMLFIDETGKIVQIVENTVPFSHDEIRSDQSVKGVLELKAGISDKMGIKTGNIVVHSFFNLENSENNM